jgi:hypothetical protein
VKTRIEIYFERKIIMDYEKMISRANPALIVLALDDSASMADDLPGTSDPKYKWVERYCGIIFNDLLERSSDVKGNDVVVKPRYYIHVIKYGSTPELWGTKEMDIQTAVEMFSHCGNSLGLGGQLGGTDAKAALEQAYDYLQKALATDRFKDSFPPMVFHLTDGESQTDASDVANQIKQLSTNDGNVLLVNAYIGTQTSLTYKDPADFPGYTDVSEAGPSQDNVRLFEMSSQAPESITTNLKSDDIFPQLRSDARLFFDVRTKKMLKNVIQVVSSMGARMER